MFRSDKLIRFHHCDPAAIVFYPQYFVLFHELVEDWFSAGLGIDYAEFVRDRGVGLPMVKVDCEFLAPSEMGDTLTLELVVKRIGRSSIALGIRGRVRERETVRATLLVVHASVREMRPLPIPPDLRARLAQFADQGIEA
jgi:4-hydroxybenzoyl-CoA thioesterase